MVAGREVAAVFQVAVLPEDGNMALMKKYLTQELKQNIEQAVRSVELNTTGEIVPVMVEASDRYFGISLICASMTTFLMTWFVYGLFPNFSASFYFVLQVPILFLSYQTIQIPWVKRKLLMPEIVEEEVFQRALQAFYEHGVYTTEHRNGVLIFVSFLEHRVQLLADMGIDQKVEKGTWENIVREMTDALRRGCVNEAFLKAIDQVGKILERHYPTDGKSKQGLPNQLRTE